MTLYEAAQTRFKAGREEYGGKEWRGERGSREAIPEVQDAFSYIRLERECLLRGRNPDYPQPGDELTAEESTVLQVVDKLLSDLEELYKGTAMLDRLLDRQDAHAWEPLRYA